MHRRGVVYVGIVSLSGCLSSANKLIERATGLRAEKKRILTTYNDGILSYNAGIRRIETAVGFEDWTKTKNHFEPSISQLTTATEKFHDARDRSRNIEHEQAASVCSRAITSSELMTKTARKGLEAAASFSNGEYTKGDQQWQEFKHLRAEANQSNLPPARVLRRVLGLSD